MFGASGTACNRSPAGAQVPAPSAASPTVVTQVADEPGASGDAVAVLAGGCFWCVEAVYEQLAGVKAVVSGYAGGSEDTANYRMVSSGSTKHAEAVLITYDPDVVSYGELLQVFFSTAHDPTQLNRQGNDVGTQYRSAVFYRSDEEREFVQAYIDQLNAAGVFSQPIATTLEPLGDFYVAEDYHQDYAVRNPNAGYIRMVSTPKVEKTRKVFADKLKGAQSADQDQASSTQPEG